MLAAEIVDNVLAIFRQRFVSRGIAIKRHYQPDVHINIAPHELRQIATNLVSNACDAVSGPGGTIAVHILGEGGRAVLAVEDNGNGIAAQDLPRIFEPFFTTKQEIGTGIGLWVTKELVESSGGSISVEAGAPVCPMQTRFRVELPLA